MKYPRSPHEKVGGVVYFGRMLDKIRLKDSRRTPSRPAPKPRLRIRQEMRGLSSCLLRGTRQESSGRIGRLGRPGMELSPRSTDQARRKSTFGASSCEKEAGMMREPRSSSGERRKADGESRPTFKRCSITSTRTREDLVREGTRAARQNMRRLCAGSASRSEVFLEVDRYAAADHKGIAQILGAAWIDNKLRIGLNIQPRR